MADPREPRRPANLDAADDPAWLAAATDAELEAVFQHADVLPLDRLMNGGGHEIDLASRTIFNDAHWKGWLPPGLPVNDLMVRLSTGYGKRFWKQGGRFLAETLYLSGRILVKHTLEEITIDRPTNDLAPGRYLLLRYTDPVFEHIFYDVMRTPSDGVVVYRGYLGRFPDGKRGLTAVMMRRYGFAQMGVRDHERLAADAAPTTEAHLAGTWRLEAIDTSNHAVTIGSVTIGQAPDGRLESRAVEVKSDPSPLVPDFVIERFTSRDLSALARELRTVDHDTMLGTWTTELRGPYAKLLVAGTQGLFHTSREKGARRRFTLYYVLRK